jgi:hypothetical protein
VLDVGGADALVPFAVPQMPLTGIVTTQSAFEPFAPAHVQLYVGWHAVFGQLHVAPSAHMQFGVLQISDCETAEALPTLQRAALEVGAMEEVVPSADPQTPVPP